MADFFQPEPRSSSTKTILISALVLVALFAAGFFYFFHHENHPFAEARITSVQTLPIHTVFKHQMGEEIEDRSEDVIYLIAQVTVDNRFRAPLFLKDLYADLTPPEGAELHSSAAEPRDIAVILASYPKLKILLDQAGKPLRRETTIAPGASASGYILLQYPVDEKAWQTRQASTLHIDFYHNSTITTLFPK
ncbi:hypothetical protein [Terriglobus saanensis]|uniref:Tat pathway signal sequence domain protein n=1 Tax=Terriglobus saanensis (strain ATCC BAA-1853 / DSM 23119 / SP1PR4) TaxID=401053 RepID=E8V563_TERSS|nr:hypothetical protein [Terriglobus saanensis]ADV83750.1 Tat pathway signal sequence domain protein [Terriglobus saanensis SP1PR4]